MRRTSAPALSFMLYCLIVVNASNADVITKDVAAKSIQVEDTSEDRLYFQGPDYTINLIPLAIIVKIIFVIGYVIKYITDDSSQEITGYAPADSGYSSSFHGSGSSYSPPAVSYQQPSSSYASPSNSYSAPTTNHGSPNPSFVSSQSSYSSPTSN
eukprot:maker-scaffold155_size301336-snap-gene-2.9 protein:Tk03783 transcript:maker-scaffold155_size301336-snap-gene-2.9-mRNA-1 annotation:"xylosyltransferase 1-like"